MAAPWRIAAVTVAGLLAALALYRLAAPPVGHPSIISERIVP